MRNTASSTGRVLLSFLLIFSVNQLYTQVTTATLSGFVKNSKGEALPGASVTVSYPEAGIKLVAAARADGRFTVPNLRVGVPYSVVASHVNLTPSGPDNVYLELSNNSVEVTLADQAKELPPLTATPHPRLSANNNTSSSHNI